jgi:large subunit ribosomal protein L9
MQVILKETIDSLGIIGTEVKVANGYARNYLIPQKKAVEATPQNRKLMEHERKRFDLQIAKEKAHAEEMAARIDGVKCTILAKVADQNKLYGSVQVRDIVLSLGKLGIEIDKRMVLLSTPIKEIGEYQVPIRIYKGVKPEITVEVVSE